MPEPTSQAVNMLTDTDIVEVTVYADQARVTRRGQVEVRGKTVVLEIEHLPSTLHPDSVQVSASGSARVTLQPPQVDLTPHSVAQSETSPGDRVQELEQALRGHKDDIIGLTLQRTFLESLIEKAALSFANQVSLQTVTLEEITQFLQFFEQSHQRVVSQIAAQEQLKHTVDLQLQQARKQASHAQKSASTAQYRIRLPVGVEQPGMLDLRLSYTVGQAGWRPAYHVRSSRDRRSVQVDWIAHVQQTTGEPWPQVALTLSTAWPEDTSAPTDPADPDAAQSAWTHPVPATVESATPLRSRSRVLDEAYRMLGAVPGSEIPAVTPEKAAQGSPISTSANAILCVSAPHAVTIPSDGQPYSVLIDQLSLEGSRTYIALSQRYSAPYLQMELVNPPDRPPLLPGTVQLFREGAYIGEDTLHYVAPGESFQLSLGLDDRISLQRALIKQESSPDAPYETVQSFQLTLHNPFDDAIDVSVVEHMPTGATGNVRVTLIQSDPPASVDQAGRCQWLVQLDPHDVRQIRYQYAIESAGRSPRAEP